VSIELDWQVVAEDAPPPDQPSSPSIKPHRTRPRVIWIALAVVALAVVSVVVYSAWAYRAGLAQASDQVRLVARLEAQAVARDDRESFMALQDPDDPAWRSVQSKRFGQLERAGLTEFGWKAAGASPQFGSVSLEPDGARLDVTYRFSVTQPLPGGPVTVSAQVPQYYKRAHPRLGARDAARFLGRLAQAQRQTHVVIYFQRDAPSSSRSCAPDEVMDRVCESLTCPVLLPITFDRFPETLLSLSDFSYGYDNNGLKLPSPHWIGLPADAASREELYRAYGTRLAQALVYKASNSRLMMSYLTSKEFVRWELAQAGLSGPFISEAVSRTLMAAPAIARQPLSAISVRSRWLGLDDSPGEVVVPLAFDFLELTARHSAALVARAGYAAHRDIGRSDQHDAASARRRLNRHGRTLCAPAQRSVVRRSAHLAGSWRCGARAMRSAIHFPSGASALMEPAWRKSRRARTRYGRRTGRRMASSWPMLKATRRWRA
jgi:hypothetical protein